MRRSAPVPNVMTSAAATRASAGPSRRVNKAGSSPASRARRSAAARGRRRAERRGLERALERRGEIERRIGDRGRGVEVDPGRAPDQHRLGRQRLALVGELQRRRAVAGDQQGGRRAVAVERGQPVGVGGLDRRGRRCRRPPPASRAAARRSRGRRPARPSKREFRHQRDMVGRPRPVAAGLVDLVRRAPASRRRAVAHIWSSRRPRSFIVQSGER